MKVVLDEGAYMPERAHPTDAGLDLRTREAFCLWPGHHHTFDTGVHIEIPAGCFGHIESKSGLNVNVRLNDHEKKTETMRILMRGFMCHMVR